MFENLRALWAVVYADGATVGQMSNSGREKGRILLADLPYRQTT